MKTGISLAMVFALSAGAVMAQDTVAITLDNPADVAGARVDGGAVTITAAGTYVLSGTMQGGSVIVDAPGAAVELILDNASINNPEGPAILLLDAGAARITLADGTRNSLSDGGNSDFDAALYSRPSLSIGGGGALEVNAVYEGIASEMHITFDGGTVDVTAMEDGINANNDGVSVITISGGYLYVETETGDGIDSNGSIVIDGGTVITLGAIVDRNSGLDADLGVAINGGTVIATAQARSPRGRRGGADPISAQPRITAALGGTQAAGTVVAISDGDGPLLVFAPAIDSVGILYSAPELEAGSQYTVEIGGTAAGTPVDGVYPADGYVPGTIVAEAGAQ